MQQLATEFDFDDLDDLSLTNSDSKNLPSAFQAGRLGPLVELLVLRKSGASHLPSLSQFNNTQRCNALRELEGDTTFFKNNQSSVQLTKVFWDEDEEPNLWLDLCRDMERQAVAVGFDRKNSRGLVSAFRELVGNIFDHSQASATGIAGYAVRQNDLEFVVADSGMGILNSLKSSPDFQSLQDSGEALKIAIQDGISRHGSQSGRGRGFRPLFQGLSNLASFLRIRSGDHALVVTGISPSLASAQIQQKVELSGVVISVSCSP